MKIIITITNDGKCKDQSYEAIADFEHSLNNSWNGYNSEARIACFGSSELEARTRLYEELIYFEKELSNAILELKTNS